MYSDKTIERFKNPKFSGDMKNPSSVGEVGNARCGDIMRVFIKVRKNKKNQDIIQDISFLTYGCVAAIVSSDILCEIAKGKTLDDAEKISSKDIAQKMESLPNIKLHCSVLAQNALKKAIENYKKRKK